MLTSENKKVLLTGASGFLGSHLFKPYRSWIQCSMRDNKWTDLIVSSKPSGIIHMAGIPHGSGSKEEIFRVNVNGTRALAEQAVRNGVKRFIYLSSVQAVPAKTTVGMGFKTSNSAFSQNVYGRSKYEAERLLRRLSMRSPMEVVIIRPPIVYGPGVKASFRNLFQVVDKGVPLPLSALESNRRSFVAVSSLIDLISLCLDHPAAANQTFHVSDDDDISTAELLRRMGKALGRPVRNLPIPQALLKTGLRLLGKGDWVDKLCGDLRVDISETKRLLGWKPKVTMEEELARTAQWWRER
jgi:nucleoside-diphosphate-sugar epimerase